MFEQNNRISVHNLFINYICFCGKRNLLTFLVTLWELKTENAWDHTVNVTFNTFCSTITNVFFKIYHVLTFFNFYFNFLHLWSVWRRVLSALEGCGQEDFDPRKKLDSLMHLAELCIEVIQQNEEYHAEVRSLRVSRLNSLSDSHCPHYEHQQPFRKMLSCIYTVCYVAWCSG